MKAENAPVIDTRPNGQSLGVGALRRQGRRDYIFEAESDGLPTRYARMDCRSGRILKLPKQSSRRMESGRRCQLAQLSGESPYASRVSNLAPYLRSSSIVASFPNAAARWSGVSPLVLASRINPPVSEIGRAHV